MLILSSACFSGFSPGRGWSIEELMFPELFLLYIRCGCKVVSWWVVRKEMPRFNLIRKRVGEAI